MPKTIDAKSAEMGMLLERIDKMVEVQNLLLDWLNICNGSEGLAPVSLQEASPCANCLRFNHVKLDCLVMAIKGQNMYRQGPWEDRLNRDEQIFWVHTLTTIIPLFSIILRRMQDFGGTMINLILRNTTVSNNNHPTPIKDSRRSSRRLNHKLTRKHHARPRWHSIQCSEPSRN